MAVLKDQLAEALAKIAALEAAAKSGTVAPSITLGQDKHGNKVLTFTGNFRPFDITVQRAKKLLPYLDNIKQFATSDGAKS